MSRTRKYVARNSASTRVIGIAPTKTPAISGVWPGVRGTVRDARSLVKRPARRRCTAAHRPPLSSVCMRIGGHHTQFPMPTGWHGLRIVSPQGCAVRTAGWGRVRLNTAHVRSARLPPDVGRDPPLLDAATGGRVVPGDGQLEAGAILELDDRLHRALAERPRADHDCAA